MADYIQVTIEDDTSWASQPQRRDFVVEVSRDTILADMSRAQSQVRSHFHAMPDLEQFVEQHLAEVQQTMAGDVALSHAGQTRPHMRTMPVHFSVSPAGKPSRPPDGSIGDFAVWNL